MTILAPQKIKQYSNFSTENIAVDQISETIIRAHLPRFSQGHGSQVQFNLLFDMPQTDESLVFGTFDEDSVLSSDKPSIIAGLILFVNQYFGWILGAIALVVFIIEMGIIYGRPFSKSSFYLYTKKQLLIVRDTLSKNIYFRQSFANIWDLKLKVDDLAQAAQFFRLFKLAVVQKVRKQPITSLQEYQ